MCEKSEYFMKALQGREGGGHLGKKGGRENSEQEGGAVGI